MLTEAADVVLTDGDELQDELIVARITAGERRLFGVLYQRYRARIVALAFGMTGQREQAEDLTQEIFLRVYQRLDTFQGQAKVRHVVLPNRVEPLSQSLPVRAPSPKTTNQA